MERKNINIEIPKVLHSKLKKEAAIKGIYLREYIIELLEDGTI